MKDRQISIHQHSEIFFMIMLVLFLAIIYFQIEKEKEKNKPLPPIKTLDEASGYTFETGSARLSEQFIRKLKEKIIPELEQLLVEHTNLKIIEVIGHTDGQVIHNQIGNLDTDLETVFQKPGMEATYELKPTSNADLGLMRAISVIKFIKENSNEKLKSVTFYPYSAAQLILPDGRVAGVDRKPDAKRRRIELRFRGK